MRRLVWILVFVELGLALLGLGLLVPAHLRAVDEAVVIQAGALTRSLTEEGATLVSQEKLGPAQLFLQIIQAENLPGKDTLGLAVGKYAVAHPDLLIWGGPDPYLERLFQTNRSLPRNLSQPVTEFLRQLENRERLLEFLGASRRPAVVELLQTRDLTNTVYFPPVATVSGHTLDAIIVLTGLLLQGDHLTPALHEEIGALVVAANRKNDPEKLERVFLDLLTLAKRLNWAQLTLFINRIEDLATLRNLAHLVRANEARVPWLFTAVCFTGQPAAVSGYLMKFQDGGMKDMTLGLRTGLGGLQELLKRQQPVYRPLGVRQSVVAYEPFGTFYRTSLVWCENLPWMTLLLKYLFFLAGGFCLAHSYQYWRPAVSVLEQPLQVPTLAPARQGLWALFFLLIMVFVSEPFLAQESQPVEIPLRIHLPRLGNQIPPGASRATESLMNQLSLLSLLLFFVLQALIYAVCLLKLAEIRRQNAEPRLKLRLLENEEHLFDAGLYLGFVGTIISLILMSLGIVKPSLMAGYSSTSFGIIFVSILKIFHVRPFRRKLILESENPPS
jgi:hypothetical protein